MSQESIEPRFNITIKTTESVVDMPADVKHFERVEHLHGNTYCFSIDCSKSIISWISISCKKGMEFTLQEGATIHARTLDGPIMGEEYTIGTIYSHKPRTEIIVPEAASKTGTLWIAVCLDSRTRIEGVRHDLFGSWSKKGDYQEIVH